MKIVFLNLADRHEHGLARTTVAALKRKYPRYSWIYEKAAGANVVDLIDLFELLRYQSRPRPFHDLTSYVLAAVWYVQEPTEVRRRCRQADKIMLGVHGHYGDAERGHANMGWQSEQGAVGTYREFAELLTPLFEKGRPYRRTRVMCYGARSARFDRDHTNPSALEEQDIRGSFAFKLFRELCAEYDVKMTARTGSLRFDQASGASMVQTEAALTAEAEFDALDSGVLTAAHQAEVAVQDRIFREDGNIKRFRAMETRMVDGGEPQTGDERIIRRHMDLKARANVLVPLKSADQGKYGKFVYTYNRARSRIVVTSKYPPPTVLYDGPR